MNAAPMGFPSSDKNCQSVQECHAIFRSATTSFPNQARLTP
jgi:hypothetical protein